MKNEAFCDSTTELHIKFKELLHKNNTTVMHRGALRERDEMRFDNFTRATCILYIDLVETLNFQLRCLVEKVARINNRKTVCANSLVTAHCLRVCVCCC